MEYSQEMSLSRDFLDVLRSRLSLAKVAGRKVAWNTEKSKPQAGDMWAPCPFHEEQSSSFHVDDWKGYYYCFGCKAKGDVFSFVRQTANVGFVEAVQILADEVGLPVPKENQPNEETLPYIICECSCCKVSRVSASTLEPILGTKLTSANALSLISKLRCTDCKSAPSRIYDDKMKQLSGSPKPNS